MEYTIHEMSETFGEQYFDVYVTKAGEEDYDYAFVLYGDLEGNIDMMECALGEDYDIDEVTVCVCLAGYDLAYASGPVSPDDFESLVDDEDKFDAVLKAIAA